MNIGAAARNRLLTATLCLCALPGSAGAQIDPDDTGAGHKLGLAQQRNSGQVGTVTLLGNGPAQTVVLLRIESVPRGTTERARLRRARSCAGSFTRGLALALAPVRAGGSQSSVDLPLARLLSGNYLVEVLTGSSRRVSCGLLYR